MESHCVLCASSFPVTDAERTFLRQFADTVTGGEALPEPTLCPDCRQRRRIAFRNDQLYYKNSCHFCKKNVISIYSPDKPVPVLCPVCFWSDQWDATAYGADIDFSQPFADQFAALKNRTPRLAIFNTQSENSEYTVHSSKNRNCYMGASVVESEDVYFSDWAIRCRDSSDLLSSTGMELCYSCVDSRDCFNGDFLEICVGITDSAYCFDCQSGRDLVGCVSVRNGAEMILNKQSTKEEVQATITRLKRDRAFRKEFGMKFAALKLAVPKRESWNLNVDDCSGNCLMHSKHAHDCYHSMDLEDCTHVYDAINMTDCHDCMRGSGCEMLYDCHGIIDLRSSAFCNLTYQCDNLLYCDNCHGSSYCFGCFSMKKAQYCIFNKQYTKEDYEALVPKLIAHMRQTGEWGSFFREKLSSFGYNESKAQEWFPLSRQEIRKRGWQWSDYDQGSPEGLQTITADRLPEDIDAVPDDILNIIISCEVTGRPFRLMPHELKFYRKKGLPVPRRSPQQRHHDLVVLQNPHRLYNRHCSHCSKAIRTTYAPERPEIVYCEECYLAAVY